MLTKIVSDILGSTRMQSADETVLMNPALQSHIAALATENAFASQLEHFVLPDREYLPARQLKHDTRL